MKSITIPISVALILAVVAALIVFQAQKVQGESFTGSAAVQVVATTTVVGPQSKITIFNARVGCTARVISTVDGTGTRIQFLTGDPGNGDLASTTLTNLVGLTQAASTTVIYNSGTNGCGRWTAVAPASTTITLVEYQ